jgi:hypothetical protein
VFECGMIGHLGVNVDENAMQHRHDRMQKHLRCQAPMLSLVDIADALRTEPRNYSRPIENPRTDPKLQGECPLDTGRGTGVALMRPVHAEPSGSE